MNMDEILTLVQAVSDSKLTSFKLDQGDMHIPLKKEKEEAKIITVGAPGAVAAVPAPSAAPVVTAASAGVGGSGWFRGILPEVCKNKSVFGVFSSDGGEFVHGAGSHGGSAIAASEGGCEGLETGVTGGS